uniref:Uncharacterized protein n=1 Tax=Trichogramma kaykai TaxID=54128 RepID=A0ABD2X901_9HYME
MDARTRRTRRRVKTTTTAISTASGIFVVGQNSTKSHSLCTHTQRNSRTRKRERSVLSISIYMQQQQPQSRAACLARQSVRRPSTRADAVSGNTNKLPRKFFCRCVSVKLIAADGRTSPVERSAPPELCVRLFASTPLQHAYMLLKQAQR